MKIDRYWCQRIGVLGYGFAAAGRFHGELANSQAARLPRKTAAKQLGWHGGTCRQAVRGLSHEHQKGQD